MSEKIPRSQFLAQQLQKALDTSGLKTAYYLSKATGVQEVVIRRYMAGEAKQPDAFTLVKMAKALNVSLDFLVGRDEPDVESSPAELATAAN